MLAFVPEKNTLTEDLRLINEIIAKAGGGGGLMKQQLPKHQMTVCQIDSMSPMYRI